MDNSTSTKKVVTNSLVYSLSGMLMKCCNFFLLPLYTAYLTTEDYGITSIATSFTTTMMFIVALSLYSAIMRFYVDLKENPEKLKRFYGTITTFTLVSGSFWCLFFTLFKSSITTLIFPGIDFYPIVVVCLIELVFMSETTIFDDIMKSQQKALLSSVLSIITFFAKLGLNIVFVVLLGMGALGTLLASAIVSVVYSISFAIYLCLSKKMVVCVDFAILKEALHYSVPIIPHNLATRIALLISKILIGGKTSLSSLGVYTVATQFGDIADTLQGYVDMAYQPWLYEKLHAKEEDFKKSIRETAQMLVAVLGLLFIGIALFAQDYIFLFVNNAYNEAWKYIPLIVSVYAIKTMYYFYVEILLFYKEASKKLFIATVTSSLVNLIFSYLLIPRYGIIGSIIADSVAMLIRVLIVYYISTKYDDIGLRVKDFVLNFLIIDLFVVIGLGPSIIFDIQSFRVMNFLYKIVVVLIYLAIYGIRFRRTIITIIKRKRMFD